jgi:predicted transcriptional regulator
MRRPGLKGPLRPPQDSSDRSESPFVVAPDHSTEATFFDLSHPARLEILRALARDRRRLTDLARLSRVSPPEVSRHLARLERLGLVAHASAGGFELTGSGRLIADRLPFFDFIARHRELLRNHDLTRLPPSMIGRIGELTSPETGSTFVDSLRRARRVLREAREFAWFITDQPMMSVEELAQETRGSSVPVRAVVPESILATPVRPTTRVSPEERLQFRAVPSIAVGLAMNERVAGVSFSDLQGRIDYAAGVGGTSASLLGWCRDLFEGYWREGKPFRP